jgi:hypothetical protein
VYLAWIALRFHSFYGGAPSSSATSSGSISGTRLIIPQPFASRGNLSYPVFWAATGELQYPGYKTPTLLLLFLALVEILGL